MAGERSTMVTEPIVGATLRIAIIDDHELVREGLASLLAASPDLATIVYSGDDPAQAATRGPDIALLDIDLGPGGMPVIAGIAALQSTGVRVLLISAYEESSQVRAALRAGALGFVPKRVSFDTLVEAVQTVARGELYLSIDLASILAAAPEMPGLSPRELDALRLYASGLKLNVVANRMGISPHTAKEYLDRVRAKYAQVGRSARTRTQMYVEASRDGLLES